ncbi:MAG: aspartyl protease family protein, partial [Cyanobacteria bacterium]|nr:aspartyl protease family protein [Cyanobacteriota bacterium]
MFLKRGSILEALTIAVASGFFVLSAALATEDFSTGTSLYKKGNYKEAARAFERVIKQDPQNANAMYYAGLCYQRLGADRQSRFYYGALIKGQPNSAAASLARKALGMPSGQGGAGVGRASVGSGSSLPDSESVPFQRTPSGDLVVSGQINGRSQRFIFDTGAQTVVATKKSLQAIGITPPQGAPEGYSRGAGGSTAQWSMDADITLGKIRRRMTMAVIDGQNSLPLMGQAFFNDYRYDIDNSSGTIRFSRRGAKAAAVPNDTINIPFTPNGHECVVEAKVNGQPTRLIFDTGAQRTLLKSSGSGWRFVSNTQVTGIGGGGAAEIYEVD